MNNVYPSTHPLIAAKLTRLRDVRTEPKKFRELVRELAAMLALKPPWIWPSSQLRCRLLSQ